MDDPWTTAKVVDFENTLVKGIMYGEFILHFNKE